MKEVDMEEESTSSLKLGRGIGSKPTLLEGTDWEIVFCADDKEPKSRRWLPQERLEPDKLVWITLALFKSKEDVPH